MITTNDFCKTQYGEKLYKLSLNGGFTCPNRDGTKGTVGCIFCSEGGSGDFAEDHVLGLDEQIERAKKRGSAKFKGSRYIAYFQAFTNTYGSLDRLKAVYDKFHGDKFDMLSVAVWDEPADTKKAAEELGINWNQIINAQRIPTDLYNIEGIPTIILFGPDGKIVARGVRGPQIPETVAECLAK